MEKTKARGARTPVDTAESADAARFASREYRISRGAYKAQCTFEYFIAILAGDAYLSKLLATIGLSDMQIGVISSFITLAFLFQLASIFVVGHIRNVKAAGMLCNTLSSLLFTGLYLIPFLPFAHSVKTVLVVVCILAAYFCNYFMTSMIYKWGNSFVDPGKRGVYSAEKEMISLLSGMVFTFVVGFVMDRYEAAGNLYGSFLFVAIAGLLISVCNFISLSLIRRVQSAEAQHRRSMREILANTLGSAAFRHVVLLTVLFDVGRYLTIGFMGIYKVKELMLTVGTVQLINIAGNLARFFLSKPFGRYADRTSYARGMELALCIAGLGFFLNMFSQPSAKIFVVLFTLLYAVSAAGTNQNSLNIVYSYVPMEYFVPACAIKNSIGGVCGFLASLLGARILSAVQENGNMLLGVPLYGQQLLSALSFVVIAVAVLYVHFVISRQVVLRQ